MCLLAKFPQDDRTVESDRNRINGHILILHYTYNILYNTPCEASPAARRSKRLPENGNLDTIRSTLPL